MKKFLAVLIGLLLSCSFVFVGCHPTTIGDEPTGDLDPNTEVTISFMHMWSEHATVMESIIDDFEEENPNILGRVFKVVSACLFIYIDAS